MASRRTLAYIASFLLLAAVATASANTNPPINSTALLAASMPHSAQTALITSSVMNVWLDSDPDKHTGRYDADKSKHDEGRHRGNSKTEYHGAEMTPGIMLLAGVLGVAAYLGIRRYAHRHV